MRSIAIELTPRCNQHCVYCYNAWRGNATGAGPELDGPAWCGLIDRILNETALESITLSGGEPFLRHDLFEIIDHINRWGLPVAIISNGGVLTNAVARKLAARNVAYVQITLAGPTADLHDAVCGAGAFHNTRRGVASLVRHGIKAGSSFLCTRHNCYSAAATLELMLDLGAGHHIAFNRFNPSGQARSQLRALLPTRSETLVALRQAEAFAARHDRQIHCTMPIPFCMVEAGEFPHIQLGQCSVGTEAAEYAVTTQGDLKLCPLQRTSLGSLFKSGFRELVNRGAATRFREQCPEFCRECPHRAACLGGCRAAAEWAFGDAGQLDPFLAQHVLADFDRRLAEHSCA
jgi:radical SAM protein with 4Fe4S-binding SPASM domain